MSTTQAIFDITASTYDADRAKLIPCYDAFYRRATDLIAHDAKNILDLGAGTGLLSQFVRQWYPDAHIILADLSEPMLDKARVRFANDTNVTFEVTDYTTAPINGTYDSIVSALSIHHIDDEAKRALFAKIFIALRPGGTFVNAEQVAGPTPALDARYKSSGSSRSAKPAPPPTKSPTPSTASRTTAAPPSKTSSTGCAKPASPTPIAGSKTTALPSSPEPARFIIASPFFPLHQSGRPSSA